MRPFLIFPSTATDFSDTSTECLRVITPTAAEYTIEEGGAGSIHIEHPADEYGKWKTLRNGEIILAPIYRRGQEFPQPFRIYRTAKTRKNGLPMISCDALHVFYDLNYCNVTNVSGYNVFYGMTLKEYLESNSYGLKTAADWVGTAYTNDDMYWHYGESDFSDYWSTSLSRFTRSSNIDSYTMDIICNGETVVEHLAKLAQETSTKLFCDKLRFSLNQPLEGSRAHEFNIAYGLNLYGITQTIDDSNVITIFEPTTNISMPSGDPLYPSGYVFPGNKYASMGYPFSRHASANFNYDANESESPESIRSKYLNTDVPEYFAKRTTPNVKYSVDLRAPQVSEEITGLASLEVGDSGTISDPDLEIETYQTITKKVVDLITQKVKSIELTSTNTALNYQQKWSGIVTSGQSALEKRISTI